MTSVVDVMNNACIRMGTGAVLSRLDASVQAQTLNARYDSLRDAMLCQRWRFAIARAELPALSAAPAGNLYTVQYQLPPDFLGLVQVGESYVSNLIDYRTGPDAPWVREGSRLLTNLPAPLFVRYVCRAIENEFDPWFVEALGARLAYECAERITASSSKKEDLLRDYRMVLSEAIAADAIETSPEALADEPWLLCRVSR